MTRRGLMIRVGVAIAAYAVAIGVGCRLRFVYPNREDMHYVLFRDLVPLIIAIPSTWLAYGFQRRQSYLHQLRLVWSDAVAAVHSALLYTHRTGPSSDEQGAVLAGLGLAIEGARGLFRGSGRDRGETDPIASLVSIRDEIAALGCEDAFDSSRAEASRSNIEGHWQDVRDRLLDEFDRGWPDLPSRAERSSPKSRPIGAPAGRRSRLTSHRAGR